MFEESKSALGRSSGGGDEGVSVEAVPAENVLDEDVTAINWHRPAARFEEFSRTFHRLATSGRIKSLPPKDPSSLIYAAMLFTEYEDTQVVVKPPTFVLRLLAFVGRRLGYRLD